eukprot:92661_1
MSNTVEHQRLQNDVKSYIDQCRTCIEKNDYANVIKCANMVAENATKMNDGAYHVQNESDQETDNRYSKQQMADRIEHISKKITEFEAKLKEIKANDDEANNRIETDGRTATMAMPMSVELVTAGGRESHQNVYIEPLDNADDVRLPFSETLQKHFSDEKAANLFERFLYDGHYDSDAIIDDAVIAPESNIFKYMHGLDESENLFGAIQEDCVVEYLKQLYTERYELYMKHPKDMSVELVTAGGRESHQNVYIEPLDNADDVRLPFSETLQKHFSDEKAANLFERFLYDGHYDSDAII